MGLPAIIVNAAHMKALPGRKTDVKDAEWIADLLRHGLLKASYIPDREQRQLREVARYRKSLIPISSKLDAPNPREPCGFGACDVYVLFEIGMIEERARELNRLQKVLEGANIKLDSVVSDINGKSARKLLIPIPL